MSKCVIAECEWIEGHIRYGHYELDLSDSEYEDFKLLSEDEQAEYISDNGYLVVDDYDIDDKAKPTHIQI